MTTQRVQPCIWLQNDGEAAIRLYTQLIPDSAIISLDYTTDPSGGKTLLASFRLGGIIYRAICGPAPFALNESFSLSIECADQVEVDRYWDALVEGGQAGQCGWLRDRWGLSWQVVPRRLGELLSDPNPARAQAALQAMLSMSKIIVADLEAAADAAG
jgi:predicted 3-demethylubiquinone-9 3-methyltransferase (glyoxalase superfamily)